MGITKKQMLALGAGVFSSSVLAQESCGSLFVAFGYPGANHYECHPFIDNDMQPYLAWYNGTTTITLTGNPSECPDITFKSIQNPFAIGGITVPGNSTLDRSSYDSNPFYFWFPSTSGVDIRVSLYSSSDAWVDQKQFWDLTATKSGDGYDLAGTFIGTYPSGNDFYFPGTDCWAGGDIWPVVDPDVNDAEAFAWTMSGHVSPTAADITVDETWFDEDGIEWHVLVKFTGTASEGDGPRLVTTGDAPTTDAVATAQQDGGASSTSSASSGSATESSTPSSTDSSTGSSTSPADSSSTADSGSTSSPNGAAILATDPLNLVATVFAGAVALIFY